MKTKEQNGITLVALVITVIILLILSAVAITFSLNGDGILNKTENTAQQYNDKLAKDTHEIGSVWQEIGLSDTGIGQYDTSIGIKVRHNGEEVDISKIPASEIANYYGDNVINYTTGGTYQLFYVDNAGAFGDAGRIYIQNTSFIADQYGYGIRLYDHLETTGLRDTNSLIYKLNPLWAIDITGDSSANLVNLTDSQIKTKYKGAAYLCNTQNWNTTYVTTEDEAKGVWAIGAVPVEMWCASYNARLNPTTQIHTRSGYYSAYGTYGYEYREGEQGNYSQNLNNFHASTDCNGMYYGGKTSWFSSPAINADGYVCEVKEYNNGTIGHDSIRRRRLSTCSCVNPWKL